MERKNFLKHSFGFLSVAAVIEACKKDEVAATASGTSGSGSSSCIESPTEVEGPYPYVGGEITNPLQRADITGGQPGLPLSLNFEVVDINNSCAAVAGARVDIWHCNKDGYYSGYGNQTGGTLGTKSYTGENWLRGFQLAGTDGKLSFQTIYPGWYQGRATHIHLEVFVNNVLKKTTQVTFSETISDAVHLSSLYAAHGINTTRNASDGILGNPATDLANETIALAGDLGAGYSGSHTIGIAL